MISTQVTSYPSPQSACKFGTVICNYVIRDAILADDIFREEPGQFQRVHILLARKVDMHLGQSVHNNYNPGVAQSR